MIRKATPSDIPAIIRLGMEALNRGAYENLIISHERVHEMARHCVTSSRNFAWVAERNGAVGGAVCGLVHDCMFYERQQLSVLQFYCSIPGDGIKLLRELLRWAHGRPVIKMIVFTLEADADPRIEKLLTRLGLTKKLPVYLQTR